MSNDSDCRICGLHCGDRYYLEVHATTCLENWLAGSHDSKSDLLTNKVVDLVVRKRRIKHLTKFNLQEIENILKKGCNCPECCFLNISAREVINLRKVLWVDDKNECTKEQQRNSDILELLRLSVKPGFVSPTALGRYVCLDGYLLLSGISDTKLKRLLAIFGKENQQDDVFEKSLLSDTTQAENSQGQKIDFQTRMEEIGNIIIKDYNNKKVIISWLRDWVSKYCNTSPTDSSVLYIPERCPWVSLFQWFINDNPDNIVSEEHFQNIRRSIFPFLRKAKITGQALCTICEECKGRDTSFFEGRFRGHLEEQEKCRMEYDNNKHLSTKFPTQYCTVTIDYMSKVPIPSFKIVTKENFLLKLPEIVTCGQIDHGGNNLNLSLNFGFFGKGANSTITLLHWYLCCRWGKKDFIPPTLLVHADNTVSENKNYAMIGYLGMLVGYGIVNEAQINFLTVGHTHCDVDANFGCIKERFNSSLYLRTGDHYTELIKRTKFQFPFNSPSAVTVEWVTGCWDWVRTMYPYLSPIQGIAKCGGIKVVKENGLPLAYVREKCFMDYPPKGNGIKVFKTTVLPPWPKLIPVSDRCSLVPNKEDEETISCIINILKEDSKSIGYWSKFLHTLKPSIPENSSSFAIFNNVLLERSLVLDSPISKHSIFRLKVNHWEGLQYKSKLKRIYQNCIKLGGAFLIKGNPSNNYTKNSIPSIGILTTLAVEVTGIDKNSVGGFNFFEEIDKGSNKFFLSTKTEKVHLFNVISPVFFSKDYDSSPNADFIIYYLTSQSKKEIRKYFPTIDLPEVEVPYAKCCFYIQDGLLPENNSHLSILENNPEYIEETQAYDSDSPAETNNKKPRISSKPKPKPKGKSKGKPKGNTTKQVIQISSSTTDGYQEESDSSSTTNTDDETFVPKR